MLLLLSTVFINGFSTLLEKKFQLSVKNNFATMIMLNLINAVFGCIYFLCLCKFNIRMNLTTFAFSFGYSMLVFNSLAISLVALSRMSIPVRGIVGMLGSVLVSVLVGKFFFNEEITFNAVLSVVFLIAAVILPNIKSNEMKSGKNSVWVCIWLFLSYGVNSVYLKFYTENPKCLDANNMFFMTNFICLIICAITVIIYLAASGRRGQKGKISVLGPKQIVNIGARTALSNISVIIGVFVISVMDVSVYTIVISSLGLVAGTLISKFIFCEDLTWKNYVSVLLAIVSILVGAI